MKKLHVPALLLVLLAVAAPARAALDPSRTITVYVHGFEQAGAGRTGIYGDLKRVAALDSIAALAGVPVARSLSILAPNAALAVEYYGDAAPAYYTPADVQDVALATTQWGGGVPRYAVIVGKLIEHVLETSGASQVNVVSASFGTLVARWMIEKDVEGLASGGRIARWLTAEGLLSGNWAASHGQFVSWVNAISPLSIDVDHMDYGWVEGNLHAPRTQADDAKYGSILIGQIASTDDSYLDGGLSGLMTSVNDYQPNDGVQAVADMTFQDVTPRSMLLGRPPTLSMFHVNHYELSKTRAAWAQLATFLIGHRRVRVVMTEARVLDLHEPQQPWWDWRPAEVVFQSLVHSLRVQSRWGITGPICEVGKAGTVAPLRHFQQNGETRTVNQVIYDDLVLDDETQLRLDLHAEEIDGDARYGVYETTPNSYDDLGSGTLMVSALAPGSYSFSAGSWSCTVNVEVFEYPAAPAAGVGDGPSARAANTLIAEPNPHGSSVRLALPADVAPGSTLHIFDLTGRCVRHLSLSAGSSVLWDTRDDAGQLLPAGVYVHRVETARGAWTGKSCLIR